MSALRFFELKVSEVRQETPECVSVAFEVPAELKEQFRFTPGQYLSLRTRLDEQEVRRSYSICAAPSEGELRVAIKAVKGGKFSTLANNKLCKGDRIEVMPPLGKFSPKHIGKRYLAFAAGSGITPVMSIMKEVLLREPDSEFTLVFGNRNRANIIFREEIEGLKNRYMERLRIYHVLSRELMDVPLFNGRINAEKCKQFCEQLINLNKIDEAFLCGPEEMIFSLRETLLELGMPQGSVHMELFSSPDQPKRSHEKWKEEHALQEGPTSKVSIRLDGVTFDLNLAYSGNSILDAALAQGADLPYACKGGVCSTCRAKLVEGEVEMEVNYALEPDELKKGFILTCQSHPKTERVVVDFDAR
ncbi:MAG: phenylacetate-CoA oxygenase/reductase subunit PaaK [Bacteroidetes bacterium]|nr:phenylacetate-CoA oxygenase/reductase subunit PaaK [Bacteroidota bacterium]MBS1630126.1 phenylacetate-CoA oxygenase/reductase subunit PaaK [Bacteroidota bacterium]